MNKTPNEFRLAINMAGAISAGAYTAGVLDFLVQALEEWQKAKDAFRLQLANPGPSMTNVVPLHDVRLDAMSGASAGGMCAAIASVMLQGDFQHILTGDEGKPGSGSPPTTNTFYEGWVNQIDISKLLGTGDVDGDQPLTSLLDSTIIDSIAQSAIVLPSVLKPKPFISPDLQLFLMLTNVRGLSFPMYTDASMSTEEFVAFYGDKVRFQVVPPGGAVTDPSIKPLPLNGKMTDGGWPLLTEAAKATGAFPIFLAPRKLLRDLGDYNTPPWIGPSGPVPVPAILAETPQQPPSTWFTLNVDGGMTDNDPMEIASDFLAATNSNPVMVNGCPQNPKAPEAANCAVLSIAPFPVVERYNSGYFPQKPGDKDPANIFTMIGKLFSVLLSQSRFFGEALSDFASGLSFDRFAIAPSDPDYNGDALQGSSLGAFGGFLDRRFRKHDFLLGRRNCQKFLMSSFVLPVTNTVIADGMTECGAWAGAVQLFFKKPPPNKDAQPQNAAWIPIIPLCGSALTTVEVPARETMSEDDLNKIVNQVMGRIKAIKGPLLQNAPGIVKLVVNIATSWPVNGSIKTAIKNQLWKDLGANISPAYQNQD